MRFRYFAILGLLFLLVFFPIKILEKASGASNSVSDAQTQLVQAFILVQQADVAGASQEQISLLARSLNTALLHEEDSTIDSVNLANATAVQALNLAAAAREQALFSQLMSYSVAVIIGFGSALFVTEFHILRGLARKAIHRVRN
jgi:hypothetical protein